MFTAAPNEALTRKEKLALLDALKIVDSHFEHSKKVEIINQLLVRDAVIEPVTLDLAREASDNWPSGRGRARSNLPTSSSQAGTHGIMGRDYRYSFDAYARSSSPVFNASECDGNAP